MLLQAVHFVKTAGQKNVMLDFRRLKNWSCRDLPIFLSALLAWLSYLSTPDPPPVHEPNSGLRELLKRVQSDSCRRKIADFHRQYSHNTRLESPIVDVSPFVKDVCHRALDSHGQDFSEFLWGQPTLPKGVRKLHWLSHNTTVNVDRLPTLAYLILVGPSDTISAVSALVEHIRAADTTVLLHVDSKCPPRMHRGAALLGEGRADIFVLESQRVTWGGYSMVEVQVRVPDTPWDSEIWDGLQPQRKGNGCGEGGGSVGESEEARGGVRRREEGRKRR